MASALKLSGFVDISAVSKLLICIVFNIAMKCVDNFFMFFGAHNTFVNSRYAVFKLSVFLLCQYTGR